MSWVKTKHLNVAYASKSAAQTLDLYLPNEGKGPFPLIIEIHGGGFFIGSKSSQIAPLLEGAGHGGAQFETAANVKKILDFLDKHLK